MADAITELTATWVAGQGVQLNWTAPDDVTTGSVYEIYVLANANQAVPTWNLAQILSANVVLATGTSGLMLNEPLTAYLYPFPTPTSPPTSVALSVIHVDNTGTESTPLNISAFAPAVNPVYGPPHFQNSVALDPFGQFLANPQDSYEEIAASVAMVVGTLVGERTMLPDFGIEDPEFTNIDVTSIEQTISLWEPRANANVSVTYDDNNVASLSVAITSNLGSD